MSWQIAITVDENGGDFNTKVSTIGKEDLDKLKPLFKAIKNFKPYTHTLEGLEFCHKHNYPFICQRKDLGEKSPEELYPEIDQEVFDMLMEFVNFGQLGFHTIQSIEIWKTCKKQVLFDYNDTDY